MFCQAHCKKFARLGNKLVGKMLIYCRCTFGHIESRNINWWGLGRKGNPGLRQIKIVLLTWEIDR